VSPTGDARKAMRIRLVLAGLLCCFGTASQADTGTLAVRATVLSRSLCFISGGRTMTMDFGAIDPATTATKTQTVTTSIFCIGNRASTFSISTDSGLHEFGAGNPRMQNGTAATEFLPYSLAISPASGTISAALGGSPVTITGSITPAQFQNARFGAYSDTVAITLNP
jgi:spore coat protein U-like protein